MDIEWNTTLTYLFSIIAIIISITATIMTKRNLKKQLRLGKLEEMLEILHFFNGYYNSMLRVFIGVEKSIESLENSDEITNEIKETLKYRKLLVQTLNKETVTHKISRLRVLSNAYLNNSKKVSGLKVRIHAISNIYYHMYMFIFMEGDSNIIKKNKDTIIPHPHNMQKFINKIENDLIIEMNLGYKSISNGAEDVYFQTQFKKDLEI